MENGGTVHRRSSLASIVALMVALLVLAFGLAGCSEQEPQSVSDGVITIEVPGSWTVEEADESTEYLEDYGYSVTTAYYATDEDGVGVILYSIEDVLDGTLTAELWTYSIAYGFELSGDYTVDYDSVEETTTSDDAVIDAMEFTYTDEDGDDWDGTLELIYSDDSISILVGMCLSDQVEEDGEELDEILDGVVIEDPAEPLFLDEEALEEELEELEEETEDTDESSDVETLTDGQIGDDEYTLTLSGTWYVEESVDDTLGTSTFTVYDESYTTAISFMPSTPTVDYGYTTIDDFESDFFYGMGMDESECTESTTSDGVVIHTYDYSDDYGNVGYIELAYSGDTCAVIVALTADDTALSSLTTVLDSLTVANPSAPSIS